MRMQATAATSCLPGALDRPARLVCLGGERVLIRPIRPNDAKAHAAFVRRLTPEDLRFRFFTGVHDLSEAEMFRFTSVDHLSETAFIAIREATLETVGVARLARAPGGSEGEFAIVVAPAMKRKGLGAELIRRLIGWARAHGLTAITGQVMAENAEMLRLARRLGFNLRREPEAPDLVEVRLSVGAEGVPGGPG
ncbi:MAG: GNAT family N-acetyltransferase [Acetobacteraceae bacterium]